MFWSGGFRYPSISEDWFKLKEREIAIYDSTEYQKFQNISDSIAYIKPFCEIGPYSFDEWSINNQLSQIFDGDELKPNRYVSGYYFKKEDENIIRFGGRDLSDKYFEIKKSVYNTLIIK